MILCVGIPYPEFAFVLILFTWVLLVYTPVFAPMEGIM
jgi:hypothetical protein